MVRFSFTAAVLGGITLAAGCHQAPPPYVQAPPQQMMPHQAPMQQMPPQAQGQMMQQPMMPQSQPGVPSQGSAFHPDQQIPGSSAGPVEYGSP